METRVRKQIKQIKKHARQIIPSLVEMGHHAQGCVSTSLSLLDGEQWLNGDGDGGEGVWVV